MHSIECQITNALDFLYENRKHLTKRDSKMYGVTTFGQLKSLIDNGIISNDMNREEELEIFKNLFNKINHMVRYIDGISRKPHLQLSFITDKGKKLYISDDGTMMALAFGKFFESPGPTGDQLSNMIANIKQNYNLDGSEEFINSISSWLNTLSETEMRVKYSLRQILSKTKMFEYFYNTTLNFEVNKLNTVLHIRDQQNANTQPNPWTANNFYKAPIKANDKYFKVFAGDRLQHEVFPEVPGFSKKTTSKHGDILFRTYYKDDKTKRSDLDVPFYTVRSALLNTQKFQDILDTNEYFLKFNEHRNEKFANYWFARYEDLVEQVSFDDMKNFVQNEFMIAQNSHLSYADDAGGWKKIQDTIKHIKNANGIGSCGALDDLTPFKDDFAMYMVYVTLALHNLNSSAFSRNPYKNIAKIRDTLISNIIHIIRTETFWNGQLVDTFGLFYDVDGKNNVRNWGARFEAVWSPAIHETFKQMTDKKKGETLFDRQVQHQKDMIDMIRSQNRFQTVYYAFPHTNDELVRIDFSEPSKCMHGLHCKARDEGGTAADGIIWGLAADNEGSWKYKDLNHAFAQPHEYWRSLGDRNVDMLNRSDITLDTKQKRMVEKFIDLCYAIDESGMKYLK